MYGDKNMVSCIQNTRYICIASLSIDSKHTIIFHKRILLTSDSRFLTTVYLALWGVDIMPWTDKEINGAYRRYMRYIVMTTLMYTLFSIELDSHAQFNIELCFKIKEYLFGQCP